MAYLMDNAYSGQYDEIYISKLLKGGYTLDKISGCIMGY